MLKAVSHDLTAVRDRPGDMDPRIIVGTDGDDHLTGGDRNNEILGKDGDDLLSGKSGSDYIEGDGGADTLNGNGGDDILSSSGADGQDDHARDLLSGGAGDDVLSGGAGDHLHGGDGVDTAYLDYSDLGALHLDLRSNTPGGKLVLPQDIQLQGIEVLHVALGGGADVVSIRTPARLELFGGGGDDHLSGGKSHVFFDGQSGDDTLQGGRLGSTLQGAAGADHLTGGQKGDVLAGGDGADTLMGRAGDDLISGGLGQDRMTGGKGLNTFTFANTGDSAAAAPDLITDLHNRDVIDLSAIDADTTISRHQVFQLVKAFDGHAGELVVSYAAAGHMTLIQGDTDGDGAADLQIDVAGKHAHFDGFVL